jgi:hypothetical protein
VKDLELVRRMAALDPAPVFMGGYAKEALLHGGLTRPHEDFDWLLPRSEAAVRIEQAESLGFGGWQTIGEAAPGEPFYMAGEGGGHKLELGICDEDGGRLWVKVHALAFDGATGFRAALPDDTFRHPSVELDGVAIRVASPRALIQIELALEPAFGAVSERHRATTRELRDRFLPEVPEADLAPLRESIP